MADKRIVAYHLSRLDDKNPQARLAAIEELALLGDIAVMEKLQQLFLHDPDAEVRRAAQEAGRRIFRQQRGL